MSVKQHASAPDRFALSLCLAVILLAVASCKDTSNPVNKIDEIVFPDSNISYEKQIQPLFNIGCATASCHEVATEQNKNLDLTSYSGLMRNFGVEVAKDTSNSRLVWSIEGRPGSTPMPPSKPLLTNQVRGIRKWIMEGAKDTP